MKNRKTSCWLVFVCLLSSCAIERDNLAERPNLYRAESALVIPRIDPRAESATPRLLYVTDRAATPGKQGAVAYGNGRSDSMALGSAQIAFGDGSWDVLERCTFEVECPDIRLKVQEATEFLRFSNVPLPVRQQGDEIVFREKELEQYRRQGTAFKAMVGQEIRRTGNDRVLIFVHGVNYSFENSMTTLANIWHFLGRDVTPVAYSWPAGNGGILGYFSDRESGEFSVYHLKETLKLLADVPEVSEIDIVAHSRGTALTAMALREMVIEHRAAGRHPRREMKTRVLVFAAADLDTGVVRMRLAAERVEEAFEQMNFYVNPRDGALRLSSLLTKAPRFGALDPTEMSREQLRSLQRDRLAYFIQVENAGNRPGHAYFRENPAVMSDIVLALGEGNRPGSARRPLELDSDGLWRIHSNYPGPRLVPPEFEPAGR